MTPAEFLSEAEICSRALHGMNRGTASMEHRSAEALRAGGAAVAVLTEEIVALRATVDRQAACIGRAEVELEQPREEKSMEGMLSHGQQLADLCKQRDTLLEALRMAQESK